MMKCTQDCFVFLSLLSLIISGCSSPKSESAETISTTSIVSPQPRVTQTPETIPSSTPTSLPMSISTLRAYPTPISVFDYPNQVTDGKLLFSVEKLLEKCYIVGEPIKLRFTFRNLTDRAIIISGDFAIAINMHGEGGNILPVIMSLDGEAVYSYADLSLIDTFWASSAKPVTVFGNQQIEVVLAYKFPRFVVHPPITQTYDYVTPSPGKYSLRFVYSGPSGAVGSNPIELCIAN